MIKHYLKVAIRNLSRNKIFALINILGLAMGMGVCLLIYQYIHFELSYDDFHSDADNLYRITTTEHRNGENIGTSVYAPYSLGVTGRETIPAIEEVVRVCPQDLGFAVINPEKNEPYQEEGTWYVDNNFFQLFDFPFKYGDPVSALSKDYNVVITEEIAIKYFDDNDPLGKSLRFSLGNLSGDFIVTGVLEALPKNSHLQFDFLLPLNFLLDKNIFYKESDPNGWGLADFVSYVKLTESANKDQVSTKLEELITTHGIGDFANENSKWKVGFQPVKDIHLRTDYARDLASNNASIHDIQLFSVIGIFILLMAWTNYINLSTAQSIQRAKEVGVRKSIGAQRKQLIAQFMVESFLMNFAAAGLSIIVALSILPLLHNILGTTIALTVLRDPQFWMGFSIVVIFGSIVSGLYPAFVLSSFKPLSAFKSVSFSLKGGFNLRKSLIVFQFLMSILLIAGTYLVYKQITFMKNKDLGMDMEKILVVNGARVFMETLEEEGITIESKYQTFKNKVSTHHAISNVSFSSSVPGKGYFYTEDYRVSDYAQEKDRTVNVALVDIDFPSTYGLEFLAKADFYRGIPADQSTIINEEAVKEFGLGSAEEALHKSLINNWGDTLEVLGVVKNFHWSSLRDAQSPVLLVINNVYGAYYSVNINLANIQETIAHIENAYHAVFPNDPFVYSFLDQDFNRQYQADVQFGKLFSAFSLLALFIACLGLFALVSYSTTLKVKEIGIRKVLGASVTNLMILLSREYLLLLLIATVIAIPAIIFGANSWLDNYAYKIGIGIELILIPGFMLFIISLITMSYRTYVTASANPVKSLKSE